MVTGGVWSGRFLRRRVTQSSDTYENSAFATATAAASPKTVLRAVADMSAVVPPAVVKGV